MDTQIRKLKNGETLVLREAREEDANAALEYVRTVGGESGYLTFGPGEFELTESDEREFLRAYRHSENQLCMLALIGEEIAGNLIFTAGQRPRVRHAGELGMSVRRRYWGHGVGSAMLDAFLHWARETGILKKINLRVRTDNARALRLYERKGFRIEGTLAKEICVDGVFHDHHWMGLEL